MAPGMNGALLRRFPGLFDDDEIVDHGKGWSVGFATGLVAAMLSVRTTISERGPERVNNATHRSSSSTLPLQPILPTSPSPDSTCPNLQHVNTRSRDRSSTLGMANDSMQDER